MYELIEKDDWEFSVDIEKTKEYYRTYSDLCDCDPCRNFYKTIQGYSTELTAFLGQFGINNRLRQSGIYLTGIVRQSITLRITLFTEPPQTVVAMKLTSD